MMKGRSAEAAADECQLRRQSLNEEGSSISETLLRTMRYCKQMGTKSLSVDTTQQCDARPFRLTRTSQYWHEYTVQLLGIRSLQAT
jgi:hypothetical protein